MIVARAMLSKPSSSIRSHIAQALSKAGFELRGDSILIVTAMISEWYHEVNPYISREVNYRDYRENERIGNLGLLSMLLTMDNWQEVPPQLRLPMLLAN